MTHDPTTNEPIEIWMDGDCKVCTLSQSWCENRDTGEHLRFRDFRTAAEGELPVSRDALELSMWVRDANGDLLEGFAAWRRILSDIPGWRWLARLTGLPPLRWIGPPMYRFVARHRHRLPGRGTQRG